MISIARLAVFRVKYGPCVATDELTELTPTI